MVMRIILLVFTASLAANVAFAISRVDWLLPVALLVGWYLADFASGAVHLYMDYRPCRPGIGFHTLYFYAGDRSAPAYQSLRQQVMARAGAFERLVYDFKNHHPRPDALGRRSMATQIGSTVAAVTLPVSLLLNITCAFAPLPGWLVAATLSLIVGGTFAQYFHGTLHRNTNPWIILALRRTGLLMSPAAHQKHHDSLKRDFATNSGWSNALINPIFAYLHRHGWLTDAGLEPVS
ncbi:MAG: fatty acid desaturase CarF family protein [Sphingomonas sp.]